MKKTEWFEKGTNPVRPGWYETFSYTKDFCKLRKWDGAQWLINGAHPHFNQKWNWRGLAEKPE